MTGVASPEQQADGAARWRENAYMVLIGCTRAAMLRNKRDYWQPVQIPSSPVMR